MFGSAFTTCFLSPPNLQESKSFTIIWHFGATWNMRTCGFFKQKSTQTALLSQHSHHCRVLRHVFKDNEGAFRVHVVHKEAVHVWNGSVKWYVNLSVLWLFINLSASAGTHFVHFKLCQSQWCCQIGQKCMICQKYWSPCGVYWKKFRLLYANTYNCMLSNILFNILKYYIWFLYLNTLFMLGSHLLRPIKLIFLTCDHAGFMFTL